MKRLSIMIGMVCYIFTVQLCAVAEAQNIVDSNLTQRDFDAYKENYLDPNLLNKKGEAYYQKLQSSDFGERDHAIFFFSHFKKEELDKKVMDAIINLFKTEMARKKEFREIVRKPGIIEEKVPQDMLYLNSESYGMYHAYMCRIVGKYEDKSLLPMLIDFCLMPDVLTNFGDAAVEPVVNILLTSTNPVVEVNAISVLDEMMKPKQEGYVASGGVRSKIKKALIQAISKKNQYVRQGSVRALGNSEDADVIPILEKIAKSDREHFEKKDRTTGKMTTRYPVREEAEKALSKLKQKEVKK